MRLLLRQAHRRNAGDRRKLQPPRLTTLKQSCQKERRKYPKSAVDRKRMPTHPRRTHPASARSRRKTTQSPHHHRLSSDCLEDLRLPARSLPHNKAGRNRFFSKTTMNQELLHPRYCLRLRRCPHSAGRHLSQKGRTRHYLRVRHSLQSLSCPAKQHRQPRSEL